MAVTGEAAFVIDLATGEAAPMQELTFQEAGLKERADLQRWVLAHPEIVAPGLLLVTSEFDQWELRDQRVADRLDALFWIARVPSSSLSSSATARPTRPICKR